MADWRARRSGAAPGGVVGIKAIGGVQFEHIHKRASPLAGTPRIRQRAYRIYHEAAFYANFGPKPALAARCGRVSRKEAESAKDCREFRQLLEFVFGCCVEFVQFVAMKMERQPCAGAKTLTPDLRSGIIDAGHTGALQAFSGLPGALTVRLMADMRLSVCVYRNA